MYYYTVYSTFFTGGSGIIEFLKVKFDKIHTFLFQSASSICGEVRVELPPPDAIPRITGGAQSRVGAHPWQATLRVRARGTTTYHWCGAVIVSR